MPLPVLPGVVRASVGGAITGGSRWSNTWHWRYTPLTTPTPAAIAGLHTALMNFYGGHILSQCNAGTRLEDGAYTPLDGSSGAYVLTAALAGTGGGDSLPAEVAEVLSLRTALRGRRHRGRIFLPAMGESTSDGTGHIQPGVVSDILAGISTLYADAASAQFELGVASYGISWKTNYLTTPKTRVPSTWAPEFTVTNGVTMDATFDVMRNRKN